MMATETKTKSATYEITEYTPEILANYSEFFKSYKGDTTDELKKMSNLAGIGEKELEQIKEQLSKHPIYTEVLDGPLYTDLTKELQKIGVEINEFKDFNAETEGMEGFLDRFESLEEKVINEAKKDGVEAILNAYVSLSTHKINGKHWTRVNSYRSLRVKRILNDLDKEWSDKKTLIQYFMYKRLAKSSKKETPEWVKYFDNINECEYNDVITTKEIKEIVGKDKINYYAIKKLTEAGLLKRIKRGFYKINKIDLNKTKDKFNAIKKLYLVLQNSISTYIEPIRKIKLKEFEGKDRLLDKIYESTNNNIISVHAARKRVKEINKITKRMYKLINQE